MNLSSFLEIEILKVIHHRFEVTILLIYWEKSIPQTGLLYQNSMKWSKQVIKLIANGIGVAVQLKVSNYPPSQTWHGFKSRQAPNSTSPWPNLLHLRFGPYPFFGCCYDATNIRSDPEEVTPQTNTFKNDENFSISCSELVMLIQNNYGNRVGSIMWWKKIKNIHGSMETLENCFENGAPKRMENKINNCSNNYSWNSGWNLYTRNGTTIFPESLMFS